MLFELKIVVPDLCNRINYHCTNKFILVNFLADTGALSNLWGWKDFQDAGFGKKLTIKIAHTLVLKLFTIMTFL